MNLSKSFRTILWMFCVSQALIFLSVAAKYFSGKLCVVTFFRLRFYYQFYRNRSLYTNSSGNLIRILIIGKQFITNKKNISQQCFKRIFQWNFWLITFQGFQKHINSKQTTVVLSCSDNTTGVIKILVVVQYFHKNLHFGCLIRF